MKITLQTLVGLFVAAAPLAAHAAGNNWMSPLDNSLALSQFSIPGTHDSGALYEPVSGTAKCQNLSIADQLTAGVRFLDIRCRHINDAFAIHHGQVYQNQNFDDVLNAVIGFLNSNPSETVIMSVKEEYNATGNTRSFEATFDWYVAKNPSKWLLGSGIPTLGSARGKIVLFRRFGASATPKGIDASNWPDNTSFSTGGTLRVQDNYNVSNTGTKWSQVLQILNEAYSGGPNTLYVNFSSGTQSILGIPNIPGVSNSINPQLSSFFSANVSGHYGSVLMDFADATKCALIYNTSFAAGRPVSKPAFYMLINKNSGKAMDLIGGDTSNGAGIRQWTVDVNGPNQRWGLAPTENANHFRITSWVSGKCACIDQDSLNDGALLHDFDYTGNNTGQQFDLVDAGNGWYKIKNVKSGKVLDVAGYSTADNAPIDQWTDNSTIGNNPDNQLWRLQPWGDYYVRADSGRYIAVQSAGSANGAPLIQYDWESNPWFQWRFTNTANGLSKISPLNSLTRVISVWQGSSTPGQYTVIWDYLSGGDQQIRPWPLTDGRIKFYFSHDGQTWDIPGGQTGNNIPLEQYPDNTNSWQKFKLERVQ